ncbi:hypothetical protein P389DRAFT_174330 [Cystobasidium minutum MCA 4210]|uniref:uncharacterized protein n=1 Tax=Cystobasidium minutum MCA 4210 TaxID=1397322 RepID=UPI0034CF0D1F|eukprot:jgi/Rhomi1/174330/fgenesh1_kg.7_\
MTSVEQLQAKLQSLNLAQNASNAIDKKDIKLTLELFGQQNVERSTVGVAYAYLASILLGKPGDSASQNSRRTAAIQAIMDILDAWLSETSLPELAHAFAALTALLEVDKASFQEVIQTNATEEKVLEAGDIITAQYKIVDPVEYIHAKATLASFISQAAAQATALAKKLANPDGSNWLYNRFMDSNEDMSIRTAAAVAFVKFQAIVSPRTNALAGSAQGEGSSMLNPSTTELLKTLKEAIQGKESSTSTRTLQLGLEGLGVATLKPSARRTLSKDTAFIKQLLGLGTQAAYQYSTGVILGNLTKYPRAVDADEKVKADLRRYANQGSSVEEEPEKEEEMNERCGLLLQAGIMQNVVSYSKSASVAIQRLCGQIILGLVECTKFRGLVIQQGGAKALSEVILKSSIWKTPESPKPDDYIAVQALAKLLITSNPLMVLGPTPESPLLVASLEPLAAPIVYEGSTLLQRFESLMALTNVTSLSQDLQERLATQPAFSDKLDSLILESDSSQGGTMVRRAAVELLCNLAACETTFTRYTAIDKEADLKDGHLPNPVASRINILLALSDTEDAPTREAALGTLATFTLAPTVAKYLSADEKRFERVEKPLNPVRTGDDGMQLRAIECLKNIASTVSWRRDEVERIFSEVIDASKDQAVRSAGEESLHLLSA